MPPDECELRELVGVALDAFVDARGLVAIAPNIDFDPATLPAAVRHFLRVATLPSDPEPIGCGEESLYLWTVQVLVYARAGIGEYAPLRLAEAIRAAFPRFHDFGGVHHVYRVVRTASIAPPVSSGAWAFLPVRFRVQCIA